MRDLALTGYDPNPQGTVNNRIYASAFLAARCAYVGFCCSDSLWLTPLVFLLVLSSKSAQDAKAVTFKPLPPPPPPQEQVQVQ